MGHTGRTLPELSSCFTALLEAVLTGARLHFRCLIKSHSANRASGGDGDLCVGILGMGHMGKQLLLSLLGKSGVKPSHIKVSKRRPELAGTLTKKDTSRHSQGQIKVILLHETALCFLFCKYDANNPNVRKGNSRLYQ